MGALVTLAGKYWREVVIAVCLGALLMMWNVIGNRDTTITGLNEEIVRINTTNTVNTKWTDATTGVLTTVIAEQNAGIDRVIKAVSESAAGISATMDTKRAEDAKNATVLKTYITNLPKATDCSIMMDNLIKSGGAVKW